MVKAWWILLRGTNLLFLGAIPVLLHYLLLAPSFAVSLNDFQTIVFVISSTCLAACGYIINDIYDLHADRINKPEKTVIGNQISENSAFWAFGISAAISLAMAGILCYQLDLWNYGYIPVISLAFLILYAIDFKGRLIIGNFLISLLAGLNVLSLGIVDLFPTMGDGPHQSMAIKIVGIIALFAFISTFQREVVKDIEDKEGDAKVGYKTIGTVWPLARAKVFFVFLSVLEIAGLIWMSLRFESVAISIWIYLILIGTVLLSIFFTLKGKSKVDFHRASTILKIHMFLGLISPILFIYMSTW